MTTPANNRYIDIDGDTRVGYNYIKGKYYVTNKDTTTYRSTVYHIQKVLHALDITDIDDLTLKGFKESIEELTKISYTWSDTGAYIHTLQFNDFKKYPLTIDCEKSRLYIMNSTVVYDLTLNESNKNVRVPHLCAFYKDTLGLYISPTDMLYFCNLLISYYNPTCYNQIVSREDTSTPLKYNGIIILSNYNNTSIATYNCTGNPLGKINPITVGYISTIDNTAGTITTTSNISSLQNGDKILLQGTSTEAEETTYTDDGEYTVKSVSNNVIQIAETIPVNYVFPYLVANLIVATANIVSMDANTGDITLSALPPNLVVGDKVHVENAVINTTYETISCNGTYTIQNINSTDKIIQVVEPIPTNFAGAGATLYKETPLGEVLRILSNVITLNTEVTQTELTGATITVHNENTHMGKYVISAVSGNQITVNSIEDYTPDFPKVQKPTPSEEIEINVTYVSDEYKEEFPEGTFILDNFDQLQSYVGTLETLEIPSDTIHDNMYSNVPKTMSISTQAGIDTMTLQGLYSEVYTDKNKEQE